MSFSLMMTRKEQKFTWPGRKKFGALFQQRPDQPASHPCADSFGIAQAYGFRTATVLSLCILKSHFPLCERCQLPHAARDQAIHHGDKRKPHRGVQWRLSELEPVSDGQGNQGHAIMRRPLGVFDLYICRAAQGVQLLTEGRCSPLGCLCARRVGKYRCRLLLPGGLVHCNAEIRMHESQNIHSRVRPLQGVMACL